MVLSAIMIYLTYTPSDSRYFWTYWVSPHLLRALPLLPLPQPLPLRTSLLTAPPNPPSLTNPPQCTVWVLLSFGYMMDVLFASSSSFVFDPSPESWRRKTDPQS